MYPEIDTDGQLRSLGNVLIEVRDLDWWDQVDDRIDAYYESRGITPPSCRFQYTRGFGWSVIYDDDYEHTLRGFHRTETLGEMLDLVGIPLAYQSSDVERELRNIALSVAAIGAESDYEQGLIRLCRFIGYTLHVVPSEEDIPDVPRDFPEALHIKDNIWCVNLRRDEGFLWHEAGHAFLAYIQNWGMQNSGVHWVWGDRYSDEGMACAAAGAIMTAFGVPAEQRYSINSHVEHYPTENGEHMQDHIMWCRILITFLRDGIEEARQLYRDLSEEDDE